MTAQADKAATFMALHQRGRPLLMPNPWDAGSARLLASLGFEALATTSSGHAATHGRLDYDVTREEALTNAAEIVGATDLPVSADLEDCFSAELDGVTETIRLAIGRTRRLFDRGLLRGRGRSDLERSRAVERVAAAADAAHSGAERLVLTGRAENYLHGRPDLADTIARLEAYQEAGADVLYAPGLADIGEIRRVVESLDRPVNVLAIPGAPPVEELAAVGVARISVGGAFAFVALGALVEAASELRECGTYGYAELAAAGRRAAQAAFGI